MSRGLQLIVNSLVGVLFFLIFLYFLFPEDEVVAHMLNKVQAAFKGKYRLQVDEIDGSLLFDSELKGVKIFGAGSGEPLMSVDELELGVAYLPLLSGVVKGHTEFAIKKGQVEAEFNYDGKNLSFDSDMSKLALQEFPLLKESLKMAMTGQLTGTIAGQLKLDDASKTDLEVQLILAGLKLAESHWNLQGLALDLPAIDLTGKEGKAAIDMKVASGRGEIKNFAFVGGDLDLTFKGKLVFAKQWSNTNLNLRGTFKVAEHLRDSLPFLGLIDGEKAEDGSYPLSLSGSLSRPKVRVGNMQLL